MFISYRKIYNDFFLKNLKEEVSDKRKTKCAMQKFVVKYCRKNDGQVISLILYLLNRNIS